MFTKDLRFVTHIHGLPVTIFDLVADMPNYGRWLPNFPVCEGTVDVAPYPARLGTAYLDAGPIEKPGSAAEYDFPKHISFHAHGASGIAMACEDCKRGKSVFNRSPPCKEINQSTLQMFYLQARSFALTFHRSFSSAMAGNLPSAGTHGTRRYRDPGGKRSAVPVH
jgi:hypothetical protein